MMNLLSKSSPFAKQLFCTITVQRFSSQSKYQFTLPNGNLSNEQRQFYEKNGFVVIPNLVKPKTLEHFR